MIQQRDFPWPHSITDQLISRQLLEILEDRAMLCVATGRFGLLHDLDMPDVDLSHYHQCLRDFQPQLGHLELHTHLAVHRKDYAYPTHCDHPHKQASVISHVWPDQGLGTQLHESQTGPAVAEIAWQVGTSTFFKGVYGQTWHSYRGDGRHPRATLNSFFVTPGTNPSGRP